MSPRQLANDLRRASDSEGEPSDHLYVLIDQAIEHLNKPAIECLVLRREEEQKGIGKYYRFMILNGPNMGRWTNYYGVHCLADTPDCKEFARNSHEMNPGTELVTTYIEKLQ